MRNQDIEKIMNVGFIITVNGQVELKRVTGNREQKSKH